MVERVLAEPNQTTPERITRMYVAAFGRSPTDSELKDAQDFLTEQAKEYGKADDFHGVRPICAMCCSTSAEFIFLN